MATLNFDARTVAPDTGFDTVPAGWYNVLVDESELKPTKNGDGAYLNVRYNILDGQFAGRKLFSRINLKNANPVAQEIGFKQLSAIAHATGVLQVADSSQLHNIPIKVKVKIRKDKEGEYEDQNEITTWKNINEQVGAVAGAPAIGAPTYQQQTPQQAPQNWSPPPGAQPPAQNAAPAWTPPAQQFQQQPQQPPQQAQAWTPPSTQQPWNNPAQQPQQVQQTPQQAPQQAQPAPYNPAGTSPPWAQPR